MVKGKIIWSHKARIKLYEIMEFYAKRNGNITYSDRLYKLFTKNTKLLLKHPKLGTKTTVESVRGKTSGRPRRVIRKAQDRHRTGHQQKSCASGGITVDVVEIVGIRGCQEAIGDYG